MRTLHVVHCYFPVVGGSETLVQKIAEGASERGDEVWVFTSTARTTADFVRPAPDTLAPGIVHLNGVSVRRFPYVRLPSGLRRAFDLLAPAWWSLRLPGYGPMKVAWVGPHLPGLVREAVRLRPDLIVTAACPFRPIYVAARAAARARVPVAIIPCIHPGDSWVLDNPALLSLLRRADAVLTLTPYERTFLQSLGVDPLRLYWLGGGVVVDEPTRVPAPTGGDLRARFAIARDAPIVLFLGRKEEGKGVRHVVDAMQRLWQDGSQAVLVLAGAVTEYSRHTLAPYLGSLPAVVRSRIISRDDIDEGEKWQWYRECELLAHPSSVESFGLVFLEAWRSGKPIIGCRSGPMMSLIDHGRDGLLVGYGNVDELTQAIEMLLANPDTARAMGRTGRAKALADFTWPHVVERARLIFRDVVERYHDASSHQRHRRHLQ